MAGRRSEPKGHLLGRLMIDAADSRRLDAKNMIHDDEIGIE